jgi:hypothetical protein
MSFNIDPKKVGSINDGGRKLKVGTFAYKIVGAAMAVVKSNPTGKEQQIVIDLQDIHEPSYNCKQFLSVMSPNDVQREIAQKTLVAIAEAAGIGGVLKPERLKSFVGKVIEITARETQGKGDKKDQTYVNLATVEAYVAGATEDTDEEEEDEEEEAPAPAPLKAGKKAKPAPAPEPEEEEEEEEEEEDEEEAPAPAAKKTRPW